jgi:hypothetical protein
MIKFDKPAKLNGSELLDELNAGNIAITTPPLIDGNGDFWLDIAEKDKAKALDIVAAHVGTTVLPDNSADKANQKAALLAKLGITAEEAALLLG